MLAIQYVATGDILPNPMNARAHSKKSVEQIARSIQEFDITNPLLVDEKLRLIAGHGRLQAIKKLSIQSVPIIQLHGLSEAQKQTLALADNRIAESSSWDRPGLIESVLFLEAESEKEGIDFLSLTGFEIPELDNLFRDLADPEDNPADAVPKVAERAVSVRGDCWILRNHRLLCGDAKSDADVATLMAGGIAAMSFTDPPYNVRVSSIGGRGKTKHREFAEASGEMPPAVFLRFLQEANQLLAKYSRKGSIHFVCMDWRHITILIEAGQEVFGELKQLIVWAKTNAGQGSFYRSQHELICVFKNGDAPHVNNFGLGQHGRNRSNVWTYPGVNTFRKGRMDELTVHPTVKPVALVADAIRDCSKRGDIILDTFLGSGTTILAAEQIGRRGYGLEIDPLYVDVAIRRWQQFTGRDAVLGSTGQTFEEVTAARLSPASGRPK